MCEIPLKYGKHSFHYKKSLRRGTPVLKQTQFIIRKVNIIVLTHLSSNDKTQVSNNSIGKPIRARLAHMYKSFALHAHGRSAMLLPLSAGKQQTRELTLSKIITITEYMYTTNAVR